VSGGLGVNHCECCDEETENRRRLEVRKVFYVCEKCLDNYELQIKPKEAGG